jgi:hypothetical protein
MVRSAPTSDAHPSARIAATPANKSLFIITVESSNVDARGTPRIPALAPLVVNDSVSVTTDSYGFSSAMIRA